MIFQANATFDAAAPDNRATIYKVPDFGEGAGAGAGAGAGGGGTAQPTYEELDAAEHVMTGHVDYDHVHSASRPIESYNPPPPHHLLKMASTSGFEMCFALSTDRCWDSQPEHVPV